MNRQEIIQKIEDIGIVAVIRLNGSDNLAKIIEALANGGVRALEITMTTPNAIEIIREISQTLSSEFLIGAGTVLDSDTAEAVINAGSQFVVSPVFKPEIIETVHKFDKAVLPGAFSATEILSAWEAGADIVKVFPATVVGPGYFKDIHGPLPQIKLTPTGGVTVENAEEFIRCGAVCLGVGSALLDRHMIQNQDWHGLEERARQFKAAVDRGRR
ncbi:MAG: bifunctional 4-hydroxy-2-oxoglutarate aldolase/2-dehydro-3-deoxy-phosphogluconate aldolase [Candidatus Marinimicrobia bacterium]|nr:bifunctional 4-hydroxy-2-oxoglutarate aldolase/2-dehydro-3-deoxy-phosphogluconate aldolase [Candidatus Neomarinimicrobiota bacterium]